MLFRVLCYEQLLKYNLSLCNIGCHTCVGGEGQEGSKGWWCLESMFLIWHLVSQIKSRDFILPVFLQNFYRIDIGVSVYYCHKCCLCAWSCMCYEITWINVSFRYTRHRPMWNKCEWPTEAKCWRSRIPKLSALAYSFQSQRRIKFKKTTDKVLVSCLRKTVKQCEHESERAQTRQYAASHTHPGSSAYIKGTSSLGASVTNTTQRGRVLVLARHFNIAASVSPEEWGPIAGK